jgi:hypothetical protein
LYNQDHCSFAKNPDLDLGLRAVLLAPFGQFIHRFTVSLKKVQTKQIHTSLATMDHDDDVEMKDANSAIDESLYSRQL